MSAGVSNPLYQSALSQKMASIWSGDYAAADEGSLFVSTLAPTASTAVACTTQALADTNPALALFNNNSAGGFNAYLRYIKTRVTVVGGSNTHKNYSAIVEQRTDKLSTQGTALGTFQNVNTNNANASGMLGFAGVNIAAAANSTLRRVGDGLVVGAVEVAFDEWIFDFAPPVWGKNLIGTTTLVSARTIPMAPVVLAPGWWYTLGFWGTSQAAAANTNGWEIGIIVRPSGQ